MKFLVSLFFLILLLYHGLFAFLNFGSGRNIVDRSVPLGRDIIRTIIVMIAIGCLLGQKNTRQQLLHRTRHYSPPLSIAIVGVVYAVIFSIILHDKSMPEILGGIKSSFFPFLIFLSATLVGQVLFSSNKHSLGNKQTNKRIKFFLRFILLGSLIRQGAKRIFPDMFFTLGYGPVGDRAPGFPPPIRYRTGPGGFPRLSGLFAGPNNYAYILILFFPGILHFLFDWKNNKKKYGPLFLLILFVGSGIATLSRGLIVARVGQIILYIAIFHWHQRIQRRKKNKTSIIVSIFLLCGAIVLLSWWKWGSTLGHINAWQEGRNAFVQQPFWGYGLGSSGPGVYRGGGFLPENMYLQILLDTGIWGFLCWVAIGIRLVRQSIWILIGRKKTQLVSEYKYLLLAQIGILGLGITGMFLHILEDGTVNYLRFGLYGIVYEINRMSIES